MRKAISILYYFIPHHYITGGKKTMTKDYYMEQAQEIITAGLYNQAVNLMDDDIRENLHTKIAPSTPVD